MICILQFDSASRSVLARLRGEGRLPNLEALAARGLEHPLETPAADFAAGAFHTLYSGVELGDHGLFYPFQWSAREQRARYATGFEAPSAIWETVAAAGARTLAIDPYESRPPRRAEGVLVCGWGFTDRAVLPRWSHPGAVGRRLERRFGRGPRATEVFGAPRPRELRRLRKRLLAAPRRVAELAEHLLGREDFDLAWLTFAAAHVAGHQFWDLSQLARRGLDDAARADLESALDDVYVAVDEAIGRVCAALPAGADVIVTSPVGMEANTSLADLLPEMLAAVLSGGPLEDRGGTIWGLRAALPPGLRAGVAAALPARAALELTARLELRGIDWGATRAFAHPADNQGYVRLNLEGRERDGIVAPDEVDDLVEELREGLASFRHRDGTPAVESVVRPPQLYPGRRAHLLPDLSVRWTAARTTGAAELRSERFGVVARHGAGSGRSGNHTPGDAWALVAPGRSSHARSTRAPRLADLAATVAARCGVEDAELAGEPLLGRGRARDAGGRDPALSGAGR